MSYIQMCQDRRAKAAASCVPCDANKQNWALLKEQETASALGGVAFRNGSAFDVGFHEHYIEVKTKMDGKRDRISMDAKAVRRKLSKAERDGKKPLTLVFDERSDRTRIYIREGVGSWELKDMTEIGSLSVLRRWLLSH